MNNVLKHCPKMFLLLSIRSASLSYWPVCEYKRTRSDRETFSRCFSPTLNFFNNSRITFKASKTDSICQLFLTFYILFGVLGLNWRSMKFRAATDFTRNRILLTQKIHSKWEYSRDGFFKWQRGQANARKGTMSLYNHTWFILKKKKVYLYPQSTQWMLTFFIKKWKHISRF